MLSECWTIILLKITLLKRDGCRRFGRPKLRWMEQRMLNVRGWRPRALDRREWKNVFEVVSVQTGLETLVVVVVNCCLKP
jgi:hypothetical protein